MATSDAPLTPSARTPADRPFLISRTFDAPRALVFKAWTEHEQIAQWLSPGGVSGSQSNSGPLSAGKTYLYNLRMGNGAVLWGKWMVRELVAPERLVYIQAFSDEQGGLGRHPMNPDWPRQMLTTVVFSERQGQTTVTLEWKPFDATATELATFAAGMDGMTKGWGGSFDRLAAFVVKR